MREKDKDRYKGLTVLVVWPHYVMASLKEIKRVEGKRKDKGKLAFRKRIK